MREIKFRAWSEYSNQMIDWVAMMNEPTTCSVLNGDDEKIHIMQYTGLKDKNGREIYEGDVIKIPAWRNAQFKVVFEAGMFRAVEGERKISMATFKGEVRCEVIGNIFENSELLEVTE